MRERGDGAAREAEERAGEEAVPAAHALHPHRRRKGRERRADHVAGHGQGGERLVVREREARQPVERDERDVVGEEERLAAGEQEDVAAGMFHQRILMHPPRPLPHREAGAYNGLRR